VAVHAQTQAVLVDPGPEGWPLADQSLVGYLNCCTANASLNYAWGGSGRA
jgi:hypothetical protein